ncbi:MAG TPA: adenylyl-sulfate kinase [Armatimonadota bacterium]|jgi:adenylylsulfate kinase
MGTGTVIWITGISSSGKSTIASEVEAQLRALGAPVENLDADDVRANLSPNLGFSEEAIDENTKRLAWMAQKLSKHGVNVLVAAVSPRRRHRDRAREWCDQFVEVQLVCPLDVCQDRDPKGLYARAARGEISDIAGMHKPYEEAENAEVVLRTHEMTIDEAAQAVVDKAKELNYL